MMVRAYEVAFRNQGDISFIVNNLYNIRTLAGKVVQRVNAIAPMTKNGKVNVFDVASEVASEIDEFEDMTRRMVEGAAYVAATYLKETGEYEVIGDDGGIWEFVTHIETYDARTGDWWL